MAEFVQFRLEEGLPELRQIERLGLLDKKEISEIVRRRKKYEYGIQRASKTKEEYLNYIKYELNLLMLLRLRRQRLGNWARYKKIEWPIAARIKRLFKKAVFHYPADVKLWLSFIEFCHRLKWEDSISELYSALLKVHNDKPDLWISAARWEAEENTSMDTARQLLLRALRFLPRSKLLHLEFFRMELNFAKFQREDFQKWIKTDKDVETLEADPVASGQLAKAIYKNAKKVIPGAKTIISFLKICNKYDFTRNLQEFIYADLAEYRSDADAMATLATRPLRHLNQTEDGTRPTADELREAECECSLNFDRAVEELPTEAMWSAYVEFCLDRLRVHRPDGSVEPSIVRLLDVFSRASSESALAAPFYVQWAQWIAERDSTECHRILKLATERFPRDSRLWEQRILKQFAVGATKSKIEKIFSTALGAVAPENSLTLWELAVSWSVLLNPTGVESIYEASLKMPVAIARVTKERYLEYVALSDCIEAARCLYKRIWNAFPISLEFCLKMCDIEEARPRPNVDFMRRVLDDACTNYGKTEVALWIRYITLERTYGDAGNDRGAFVHARAVRTLSPELVDRFITYYSLSMTQRTNEKGNV